MKNVIVLGGSGFVGRHVCEKLVRLGLNVTVPTRREVNARIVQTLPGVTVVPCDVHDPIALRRVLSNQDAVVNLVAILHGDAKAMRRVHETLAQNLAAAMHATGVKRLVHLSALGAAPEAPSRYLRSKAAGEAALQAAGLALTVLRPSVMFGADDKLLNRFAALQSVLPVMPLGSAETRFQPVWVVDVAEAVLRCLRDERTVGQTLECTGPDTLTLADMVRLAGRLSGNPRRVIALPRALAYFQAAFMQCAPGEPLLSTDNLRSMEVDNVASGNLPNLDSLGIKAARMEPIAARYLGTRGNRTHLLALRRTAGRF